MWPVWSHAVTLSQTGRVLAIQTSWLVPPVRRKWTERWTKSDGKLTLDRDFTHPGLHVHHSTLIHPSVIKSSWDASSPNDTVACIIPNQPTQPGLDASLAHQDHQDHQEHQNHHDHQDHQDHQDRRDHQVTWDRQDHHDQQDHKDHRDRQETEEESPQCTMRSTRPETGSAGRSAAWLDTTADQPTEEAILQISGAGHWFLEGWIGDHAVDFLVDSGSAVTALSCKFYQTLLKAGAPVGVLRPTDRRLRGANGSPIAILECSSCMV